MTENIYLTEDEHRALVLLSEGKTSYIIREQCEIPLSGMNFFISEIRRKTGIRDTKNPKECRAYLSRFASFLENQAPTVDQNWAIRLYMEGETYEALAHELKIPLDEAPQYLDSACQAAGIFTRDERARKIQARQYITSHFPDDRVVMTPLTLAVFRGVAEDKPLTQIGEELDRPLEWVKYTIKHNCALLGLSARGRDVQRNLIRTFLRVYDAQQITMDDPAF